MCNDRRCRLCMSPMDDGRDVRWLELSDSHSKPDSMPMPCGTVVSSFECSDSRRRLGPMAHRLSGRAAILLECRSRRVSAVRWESVLGKHVMAFSLKSLRREQNKWRLASWRYVQPRELVQVAKLVWHASKGVERDEQVGQVGQLTERRGNVGEEVVPKP